MQLQLPAQPAASSTDRNTRNASSAAAAAAQTCMCTWNAQVTQKQIQMPMHPIQMQLRALSFNLC